MVNPAATAGDRSTPMIAVTMGDPGGIGPEVVAGAIVHAAAGREARFVVFGVGAALDRAAAAMRVADGWRACVGRAAEPGGVVVIDEQAPAAATPPEPTEVGGRASMLWVEQAIEAALRPAGDADRADAVVTGPISKQAWAMAGFGRFPGHTELFAQRCGSKRWAMMLVSPRLRVILATTHVPLLAVGSHLSTARVLETIELGAQACVRLGVASPRVAVCGLNPHAGEGGLLGDEDDHLIAPAIAAAAEQGIRASGPHPADTIFGAAVRGRHDLVVAMYHDQGLIPVKLLARDEAVNLTVGLPIVRTSPDHGTAYDIAGQGKADPGSMIAAIELALTLARTRADDY
ncbi:MAG: 4-hydroxythreonine-4-phosphate dehydrogenase PdxA [Planctomycetes bacterium]|nr:4-hydroxythreonine-4-phosphate dehydrogenase PdxA [Planctomycetota bacterium]